MLFFLQIFPFLGSLKNESYPKKLTEEKEALYLKKFKLENDLEARNKLIMHNLRLVAHIVKKYDNTREEKDDLLSIGIIGLIKAVDTFKYDAPNKLATYAARCIENEILMNIRTNKNKNNHILLYQPIGLDKDGNDIRLIDIIPDENEDVILNIENEERNKELYKALEVLNERELDIIKLRYGLFNTKILTQKEIASKFEISRSYVSRIEKRALMKLYLELS